MVDLLVIPGNEIIDFFGPRISETFPRCLHPLKSAVLGPKPKRPEADFFPEPKRSSVGLRDFGDVVELKQVRPIRLFLKAHRK